METKKRKDDNESTTTDNKKIKITSDKKPSKIQLKLSTSIPVPPSV
jgi:hypothetical protein